MSHVPLIEVTRGSDVECIHAGSVAVVDVHGRLLYQAGDPAFLTFTRSTLKPFQAVPFVSTGGIGRFGFSSAETALLCASHSGEPVHVAHVQSMLGKCGCDEQHLHCGCHVPTFYSVLDQLPHAEDRFTPLHHNCSGKHAGFLAYCVQHGLPLETYLEPAHPLQQAIRGAVAHFSALPSEALRAGTDGCSAPNYAMPLSRLAHLYAQLAQGRHDDRYGDALQILFESMTGHPDLVSGTGRNDLAFMQTAPGDWVTKVGADGVQVIGIRSAGLGIAIKIGDGNMRALYTAAVAVISQLGLVADAGATPLSPWMRPQVLNYRGLRTGEVRAVFQLSSVR